MNETIITAQLPAVDVEIHKRILEDQNAECITIRMTATPSFDAVGQWLIGTNPWPLFAAFAPWFEMSRVWLPLMQPLLQPFLRPWPLASAEQKPRLESD
jgi:hypothetical protein